MAIRLKVPLVAQGEPYSCWYAAVMMVAYFRFPGPRLGVPEVMKRANKSGISPAEFSMLAKNEGLKSVPISVATTALTLEHQLRVHGPIWCAGYWFGPGHVIVLTGVDGQTVYFNDPNGGTEKTGTLAWFNQKLAKSVPDCMLYKTTLAEGGKF